MKLTGKEYWDQWRMVGFLETGRRSRQLVRTEEKMTELEKRAFAIRQQALSMWPWFVPEKWQDVPPYAKAHWLERALEENLQKRDTPP